MVSVLQTIDTNHEDMIHDAQLNYYGTTLATGSSDCTVKIFDVKNKKQVLIADLKYHQGPVWGVAWAHPMFGNILASCSYDTTVVLWQQVNGKWTNSHVLTHHKSSVNSICWAPHEFGLILACGSSDGQISILKYAHNGEWDIEEIKSAHSIGVNAVSWAPAINVYAMLNPNQNPTASTMIKRLVSGGCDSIVKIWYEDSVNKTWVEECRLEGHLDWVRDVAWAPTLTLQRQQIASCGQDGKVILWQYYAPENDQMSTGPGIMSAMHWRPLTIHTYQEVVWHCSWSLTGNMLAVSGADNIVTLWKENLEGRWIALSDIKRGPASGLPSQQQSQQAQSQSTQQQQQHQQSTMIR